MHETVNAAVYSVPEELKAPRAFEVTEPASERLTLGSLVSDFVSQVRLHFAAPAPVHDAIDLMDLTNRTPDLFNVQPVHEQQRFLRLAVKSASLKGGELRTEFEEPFESLRRWDQLSQTKHDQNEVSKAHFEVWFPR